MEVPTATSLKDIYPEDAVAVEAKRWERLLAGFKETYGKQADFVSRSPGRVNIIGEHIDYSLYECLPMAITADFLMAVSVRPSSEKPVIRIANVLPEKFPTREFEIPAEGEIPIDAEAHEWTNYFKCGLRAASKLMQKKRQDKGHFVSVGLDIYCDGSVPSGGGLSSSASFVCATALAVMKGNGEEKVDKTDLCELAIVSERDVGVNSGGMDQSASVFSERGSALLVSFKPSLRATPVAFPELDTELTFVIANSFITSDKQVTAPVCYNLRVVECTMAAYVLAKIFKLKQPLPSDSSPLGTSLRGFHDVFFEETEGIQDNTKTSVPDFQTQLEKLVELTQDYLIQEEGYTRSDITTILGITEEELKSKFESKFPVRAERFMLRQRVLHVFTEAIRVLKFHQLLSSPSAGTSSAELLKSLGDLMNSTQDSCRDLYDCSCPEIEEICEIARKNGSYGSRLTGAGWGGCSVHLVPKEKVGEITGAWEERYYRKRFPEMSEEKIGSAVVASKPGSGSFLFKVTGDKVI